MSIAQKLQAIADNQPKVYQAGKREERKHIFDELDKALVDVGAEPVQNDNPNTPIALFVGRAYDAGLESVYETIVFAQDHDNVQTVNDTLRATIKTGEKSVFFINKGWTGKCDANTVDNKGLYFFVVNETVFWGRWRNGQFNLQAITMGTNYSFVVSAGEEWLKVVLL